MKSCNIKQIPLMNPVFDKEMEDAALYALRNEHYVLGDDVRKFEEEFSARATYGLPNDAQTPFGTYSAFYSPGTGYRFDYWETSGGVTVSDVDAGQTVVTVRGLGGMLGAIYTYWSPCDIDQNLVVDMKDLGIAGRAFGTVRGDSRWDTRADITGLASLPDGIVNMRDVGLIAKHFGEPYS